MMTMIARRCTRRGAMLLAATATVLCFLAMPHTGCSALPPQARRYQAGRGGDAAGPALRKGSRVPMGLIKEKDGVYSLPPEEVDFRKKRLANTVLAGTNISTTHENLNKQLALELSYYASVTYCTSDQVLSWDCNSCKMAPKLQSLSTFYNKTYDAFGITGYHPGHDAIVIAFKGTASIEQWIENAKFEKVPLMFTDKGGKSAAAHLGFQQTYMAARPIILSELEYLVGKYSTTKVFITGHSLGGAVSSLCSLDVSLLYPHLDISTYTYGQPRVGNQAYQNLFNGSVIDNFFRYVHHRDLVPHVPLEMMGFVHAPWEVFYLETYPDGLRVCDYSGEDPQCSDQYSITMSIDDHTHYFNYHISDCHA